MALKELPGGELYQDDGGSYSNEVTARRHEAIHRQLGVRGEAAADRAELAAANAVRAFDAVRGMAGIGPTSPVDAQTAALINQADTLTRKAVTTSIEDAVDASAAALEESIRLAAGWKLGHGSPRVAAEVELLRDPDGRLTDGAAWLSIVDTDGRPGTWLDRWYGYVTGHDSHAVWLVTAPTPLGPWTWREPVVGIPGSGARMVEPLVQAHTSSPHAAWHGAELRLYFHGPKASNGYEQPTVMATSTDGRTFTSQGVVLDTEWTNGGSPYRTSVSYVTSVRHDGLYHAIWQGTTGRDTVMNGTSYVSFPVGYATSADGVKWIKRPPIIASHNGDQGLAAPGLVRLVDGWMVVGTYRAADGAGGQSLAVACYRGPSLDRLSRMEDIVLPGGRQQELTTPIFVEHDGRLWMIGGCRPPGSSTRTVTAFALSWEA